MHPSPADRECLRRLAHDYADAALRAERLGDRCVLSCKPNPAIFAGDRWDPAAAEKPLRDLLERTRGAQVEIIMKDISTVRRDPRRLWEWSARAHRLIQSS